ncbi:apolipoprotein N-acyltransferase [Shewanella alkalitolerans]|uniref:apolipoprotein N-acyltransferase n=1 Tax=Shewanella alkalitolerans TaxID=2864209 RepID=UPI001C65B685|nr:apolipoprotein N-acyltransferase [Shewanella alkalitolerans]QYJ96824.1 apolipoprotein N-acyltransferase [Shewanella alkalitolerans]
MLLRLRAIAHHPVIRLVLAYLAGASTALGFAPYALWPIYPLAMAFALGHSRRLTPKQTFLYWLSFGFGCFSVGISWVHVSIDTYGGLPLIASLGLMAILALYLALYPALAAYLSIKLVPKSLTLRFLAVFPAAWVLTEWARGWVLTGFPWLWGGYSQTNGPLAPLASNVGALGLSLVLAMIAGALALAFTHRADGQSSKGVSSNGPRSFSLRAAPLLLITALAGLGAFASAQLSPITPTGKSVKVALVQGNIAQSMKWQPEALWPTMIKYMDLSRPSLADTDLFIWPEAAIPAPEYMVEEFLDNANKVANLNNSAIITGIISKQQNRFYNSLIVLGNHQQLQQESADYRGDGSNEFRKHHLLPIGEFVPLEDLLRPLAPFFNLPMSSFARGDFQQPNLDAVGHQLAPAICYEIAFPEQLRANVNAGTELLLTVSNDAWFGRSNGPLQHMEIAQMRAIELGRPLLRATNNGVTAVVDSQGKITHSLPQFETGVLKAEVPLVSGSTGFARWGQTPLLLLCTIILIGAVIRRLRL